MPQGACSLQLLKLFGEQNPAYIRVKIKTSRKFLRQGSIMSLSPQVQKLCQQTEQEKDFRKLLLLVSQIIHSVSHNFVENEGTERDILQYIWQIKSFAANLTVEICWANFSCAETAACQG